MLVEVNLPRRLRIGHEEYTVYGNPARVGGIVTDMLLCSTRAVSGRAVNWIHQGAPAQAVTLPVTAGIHAGRPGSETAQRRPHMPTVADVEIIAKTLGSILASKPQRHGALTVIPILAPM